MKRFICISLCFSFILVSFVINVFAAEPVTPYYTWTKSPDRWNLVVNHSSTPQLPTNENTSLKTHLSAGIYNDSSDWIGFTYGDSSSMKALYYYFSLSDMVPAAPRLIYSISGLNDQSIPQIPWQSTQSGFFTFWVWSPSFDNIESVSASIKMQRFDSLGNELSLDEILCSVKSLGVHPDNSAYHGFTMSWTFTQNSVVDGMAVLNELLLYVNYTDPLNAIMTTPAIIALSRMVISNGTWDPQYIPDNPANLDADTLQQDFNDQINDAIANAPSVGRDQLFDDLTIDRYALAGYGVKSMFEDFFTEVPVIAHLFILSAAVGLFAFILSIGRKGRS